MKQIAPVNKPAKILNWLIAAILVLLPFHAFLTVWLSSAAGHYTLLRLWKEFLLVPILIGALYILLRDGQMGRKLSRLWLARLAPAYALLLLICGVTALASHNVTAKAMWYGLLVDLRFLVFFMSVLVIEARYNLLRRQWIKLLLAPAILVAAFAIAQYLLLPRDFLKHFGYGDSTIPPYETINHNIHHIRVASTLRGANPLGAYLIVPITATAVLVFKERYGRRDKLFLGAGLILALLFSFSRSAWIGAGLSVLIAVWLSIKSERAKKITAWAIAAIAVAGLFITILFRNNLSFENFIFHTDRQSSIKLSSNEGHTDAFKSAVKDITHHPLGSGTGTAGPQSIYNKDRAKIAENYFLQAGQEAGILGIILFIAICAAVGLMLFERRADPLSMILLASLAGLTFVNLLSHAWEDDTLAYIWWGLAGVALAPILTDRLKAKNGQKTKKPQTADPVH